MVHKKDHIHEHESELDAYMSCRSHKASKLKQSPAADYSKSNVGGGGDKVTSIVLRKAMCAAGAVIVHTSIYLSLGLSFLNETTRCN